MADTQQCLAAHTSSTAQVDLEQVESEFGLHIPEVVCDRAGVEEGDVLFTLPPEHSPMESYATGVFADGNLLMVDVAEAGAVSVKQGSVAKGHKMGSIDLLHHIA